MDSVTDRTYPGALQLADDSFVENRPNILMCKRKPIDISIDLPGMKKKILLLFKIQHIQMYQGAVG
ncbi:thiol-activated cytolysin family protein [Paraclostridium bifermentans]|nr:thiol-activated cytolysin family protein [Paraclostridium bifermentans]